ncbi:MAG: hypothetical protein JO104_01020 [Candidatus Eremiobacteraeota bacterium]|nr:hypothetical protein [Candidatus Eremiobacteraeota bacterium]
MRISVFCYALSLGAVVGLLAGCGGSQTPIGAPGAMPQGRAMATHAGRGASWMLPEARNDDLLYVGNDDREVYAYSYPRMKLVGQLLGIDAVTGGLCVDKNGDVFVTTQTNNSKGPTSYVYEFAHGGTNPIASLQDSYWTSSCAVDQTTGNLAVTDPVAGNVAIYAKAQGNPTYIGSPVWPNWSAYDNHGNLFVDGQTGNTGNAPYALTELPAGGSSFTVVSLNESIGLHALQWNKGELVTSFRKSIYDTTLDLYRIKITGTSGRIVGTTILNIRKKPHYRGQFLILGDNILAAGAPYACLQLWHYPSGGDAVKTLVRHLAPWGVVLSKAPSSR